jgi:hypothetical protein
MNDVLQRFCVVAAGSHWFHHHQALHPGHARGAGVQPVGGHPGATGGLWTHSQPGAGDGCTQVSDRLVHYFQTVLAVALQQMCVRMRLFKVMVPASKLGKPTRMVNCTVNSKRSVRNVCY